MSELVNVHVQKLPVRSPVRFTDCLPPHQVTLTKLQACNQVRLMSAGSVQVMALTSAHQVHAEILPVVEYFRPTARQYTALNYKGVCYGIISAVDCRSTMDATFEMTTAAEAAFQASHNGDQKATGGLLQL